MKQELCVSSAETLNTFHASPLWNYSFARSLRSRCWLGLVSPENDDALATHYFMQNVCIDQFKSPYCINSGGRGT